MRISAKEIKRWAETREAQGALPRLIRRLINITGSPLFVSFPSGDSINQPSWDGEVYSESGNAWVPEGRSYWELSCDRNVNTKADGDYAKRKKRTSRAERLGSTYVAVSARTWRDRRSWASKKKALGEWGDVRAFGADDLEQWLEQSAAVALQFAEELGLTGPGVESVQRFWDDWSMQCEPPITEAGFLAGRDDVTAGFLEGIRHALDENQREPYVVQGDSEQEAAAFACSAILSQADLSSVALVATDITGWRYVDANPGLRVVVAARTEIAANPTRREGLTVVVPQGLGAFDEALGGVYQRQACLTVHRPKLVQFEGALIEIGLDESDAKRTATATRRSWSVFRRLNARNPAIRTPNWSCDPSSSALSVVCLISAWDGRSQADRAVLESVSGRAYEDIERDLRVLGALDDSPVLQIGNAWMAKSPLELLQVLGDRITNGELDRFVAAAFRVLSEPDPQLELESKDRFAASLHGKARPQSNLVLRAICDSVARVAVRGDEVASLQAAGIKNSVANLVRSLLRDADAARWLSLASVPCALSLLAEASPEQFLDALERSLSQTEPAVRILFAETSSPAVFGRCWYAGLLWALETLAWSPVHLPRVALLLARLVRFEIEGNWGNSPLNSLLGILRAWFPQTAAPLKQRIKVVDLLLGREPDVAYKLVLGLLPTMQDIADMNARPIWRDDDAGAGHGATGEETRLMVSASAHRMIRSAKGHPERLAQLVEKLELLNEELIKRVIALLDEFASASPDDSDRETVSAALRDRIHHYLNRVKEPENALWGHLSDFKILLDRLVPESLVARHRWLFSEWHPSVPAVMDPDIHERPKAVGSMRVEALREIYKREGMDGVHRLVESVQTQAHVGWTLALLEIPAKEVAAWIVGQGGTLARPGPVAEATMHLLQMAGNDYSLEVVHAVLEKARHKQWDSSQRARFLALARAGKVTWEILATCGPEAEAAYWETIELGSWVHCPAEEFEHAHRKLLDAGRPRTALDVCKFCLDEVPPELLAEMLERTVAGEESKGPLPDSWHLGEMVDRLEKPGAIPETRLVRLEFTLVPLLGLGNEQRAKALYSAVTSQPQVFVDILCLVYKPESQDGPTESSDRVRTAARTACSVLRACRTLPGTQPDGSIDEEALVRFIDAARTLCKVADRLTMCDQTLGQILAHACVDQSDGVWPSRSVRDVLDRPELAQVRRGFILGAQNKRGVTVRAPDEGGGQERKLADEYKTWAEKLRSSHPFLAAALDDIAESYEQDGLYEDLEARLQIEGY